MKIAIIGGAGVRTPLFLQGIIQLSREVPVHEVSLMDIDSERLEVIAYVAQELVARAGRPFRVTLQSDPRAAIAGARFVVTALRVGGVMGRVIDETVPLRYDVLGQETTGPGGFCMGLRTIPVMLEYGRLIQELAPEAWLLNFTNPSGLITEAMTRVGGLRRIIGVCDGPTSTFRHLAAALGLSETRAFFDYFGLNHLGWLRSVRLDGRDALKEALESTDPQVSSQLEALREVASLGREFVTTLGMLPNEYLYYYYHNREAVAHIKASGETRGQYLLKWNEGLFQRLEAAKVTGDPNGAVRTYFDYIEARHRLYMTAETGTSPSRGDSRHRRAEAGGQLGGYERIALEIIRAIALNRGQTMVANVKNAGSIVGLATDSVVEVPCLVDGNGPRALAVGEVPLAALGLMQTVKAYESLTIEAAVTGSRRVAWQALATHPLVPSADVARQILADYLERHGPALAHLKQ